jgi:hypothetical protein
VVVGLDADGGGDAVPHVHHTGVLAGPDEHGLALGGEALQVAAGGLVRAVLRPHHGVHGQLEVVGRPAEDPLDVGGLVVGQPELTVQRRHLRGR